jgi:thiol-disulfide isomerase/thioredoxin
VKTRIPAPIGAFLTLSLAAGLPASADPAASPAAAASAPAAGTALRATIRAAAKRPMAGMALRARTSEPAAGTTALPEGADAAPPVIDPKAMTLLAEAEKAMASAVSLTADVTVVYKQTEDRYYTTDGAVSYLRPNYMRASAWEHVDGTDATPPPHDGNPTITASDGRTIWYVAKNGQYFQTAADPMGHNLASGLDPAGGFFDSARSTLNQIDSQKQQHSLVSVTYAGKQTWDGQQYDVIDWKYRQLFGRMVKGKIVVSVQDDTQTNHLYIGADRLIHRLAYETSSGQSGDRYLRNVRVNPKLTAKNFAVTLPDGAKPYVLPQPAPPSLLASGAKAPDFEANAPGGGSIHLADYAGKIVVIDFWATWCGPCQASMPHLNEVYKQTRDQDVVFLPVCVWDDQDAYDKWVKEHKTTYSFPTYFDPAGKEGKGIAGGLFNVAGIPAQFVIDKDGKIAASNVGYSKGDHRLEDELIKLGVNLPAPQNSSAAH